jgi:hypothetical protein
MGGGEMSLTPAVILSPAGAVILSEAKDRYRAKAIELPWVKSDPSVASLLQDDPRWFEL